MSIPTLHPEINADGSPDMIGVYASENRPVADDGTITYNVDAGPGPHSERMTRGDGSRVSHHYEIVALVPTFNDVLSALAEAGYSRLQLRDGRPWRRIENVNASDINGSFRAQR